MCFSISGSVGQYTVSSHSKFDAIEEDQFDVAPRVLEALDKFGSYYPKREFRCATRRFLEDFVSCVLSTVAYRSIIGQRLGCFCPLILIGGDDYAPMQLFGMLLDRLLEKGWMRVAEMEVSRSEHQSFIQGQRQLDRASMRSRSEVENVLTFCSSQAGFRVRRHLYKVYIVSIHVGFSFNVAFDSIVSCSQVF